MLYCIFYIILCILFYYIILYIIDYIFYIIYYIFVLLFCIIYYMLYIYMYIICQHCPMNKCHKLRYLVHLWTKRGGGQEVSQPCIILLAARCRSNIAKIQPHDP